MIVTRKTKLKAIAIQIEIDAYEYIEIDTDIDRLDLTCLERIVGSFSVEGYCLSVDMNIQGPHIYDIQKQLYTLYRLKEISSTYNFCITNVIEVRYL